VLSRSCTYSRLTPPLASLLLAFSLLYFL
jgi:hypothetical protein